MINGHNGLTNGMECTLQRLLSLFIKVMVTGIFAVKGPTVYTPALVAVANTVPRLSALMSKVPSLPKSVMFTSTVNSKLSQSVTTV